MNKGKKKGIIFTKFVKDDDIQVTDYENLEAVKTMWKRSLKMPVLKFKKKILIIKKNSILMYEEE